MWLPTRTKYSNEAMRFANANVRKHIDRMGLGDSPQAVSERRDHIYIGKIAEYTICEYLREELELDITTTPREDSPDLFDFKINLEIISPTGDIKSFHIYQIYSGRKRTPIQIEKDSWALVPTDQYRRHTKDLYIFAMILGDQDMPQSLNKIGQCFTKWATKEDIQKWNFIARGKSLFPYFKTRTNNYGKKMSQCRNMKDLKSLLIQSKASKKLLIA